MANETEYSKALSYIPKADPYEVSGAEKWGAAAGALASSLLALQQGRKGALAYMPLGYAHGMEL